VWFRNDLRTRDNPALESAQERGQVHAVFVVSAKQWRSHGISPLKCAFIGRSVNALSLSLAKLGIRLEVLEVPWFDDVPGAIVNLARKLEVKSVHFNVEHPVNEMRRDAATVEALSDIGVPVARFHGDTILPPGAVVTTSGSPYTRFSPFKKRWLRTVEAGQLTPYPGPVGQAPSLKPVQLSELCGERLTAGEESWPAGEQAAHRRLEVFLVQMGRHYAADRDHPGRDGTSRLSPYLAVGTLSIRQCLHAAAALNGGRLTDGLLDSWINELIWREFYRHVTALFPHISMGRAFRPEMDRLEWRHAPDELEAWKHGHTGYPLVDAGMRQLRETGWMHNRLRMVVAMFLSKHLLLDWRLGEKFFMEQLIDSDFASNNGGWQWSASTGTDAAPYFRIFNPSEQARRFDSEGQFVRRYLPELSGQRGGLNRGSALPVSPEDVYPPPIVEHRFARRRAIEHFKHI
jgi:deoxyribodipyrimidine photo-lyase